MKLLPIAAVLLATGCASMTYTTTRPDGTKTEFSGRTVFSNSTFKGLTVDGTTKTTTNGLRVTAGTTEPNPESITATGEALGNLIGTAAATAAKGVGKP